jgi:hypothetical protein
MRAATIALCSLLVARAVVAQRADEDHGKVIYEDSKGGLTDLGSGFNPLLSADGKVVFIRGRKFEYGDDFDCGNKDANNWIAEYDPATKSETILFDRALPFERAGIVFCVFEQMQVSPDGGMLYLVSSVSATSGSLAIIHLKTGRVIYVGGVNEVHVIRGGSHEGELIYQRRLMAPNSSPTYPWVHARPDGAQIRVLAEEPFTIGGHAGSDAPQLKAYLDKIGGRIEVNGRLFP